MQEDSRIEDIHKEMLLKLSKKFDKSNGSWAYDILRPPSEEFIDLNKKVEEFDSKRSIFNLQDEELDNFVKQFTPVTRREPTYASATVKITGQQNTVIPKGTIVSSISHDYSTEKEVVIGGDKEVDVVVYCTESGNSGNTLAGSINYFPITISGVETVVNITEASGGYNKEDDNSLIGRYFDYIRLPATSGNIYHYLLWAKEIEGTGVIRVQPLWNGDNTIKLVIIDSNGKPANEELVSEIQEYIDPKGELIDGTYAQWGQGYGMAPVGAFCTIESAKSRLVSINAEVKLDTDIDIENVINELRVTMAKEFAQIALDDDKNTVSVAKVGSVLLGIPGVADYKLNTLKINGQQDNIILGDDEVALFDEVILNEY